MIKAIFWFIILKSDYFSFFNKTNSLGFLAISFRRYGSFFQKASNRPKITD